jgi:N-acetylmuramoyl-L-alanine amidase
VVAICPFADWRPLPEATSQGRITPRVAIYHTMVGSLRGTERYFRESTGIESHFGVGGPWDGADLDGVIWQWMDLERRADANLDANAFAISIETSDNAPARPEDIAPWSPKQLASLVRLGNWLADRFSIPRRQCPAWDQAGFGWHAMWGAPSHWTPAVGKVCPGPARIHQLKTIVFPAIFAGTSVGGDWLDMATKEDVKDALREVLSLSVDGEMAVIQAGQVNNDKAWQVLVDRLAKLEQQHGQLSAQLAEVKRVLDGIVLGRIEGDFDVSGIMHATSVAPPPPPVTDVQTDLGP